MLSYLVFCLIPTEGGFSSVVDFASDLLFVYLRSREDALAAVFVVVACRGDLKSTIN